MALHPTCLAARVPSLEVRLQELCHTPVPVLVPVTFPWSLVEGCQDPLSTLSQRIQHVTGESLLSIQTRICQRAWRTAYGVFPTGSSSESTDELCYWVWETEDIQPQPIVLERKLIGTAIRKLHYAIQKIKENSTEAQAALEEYHTVNEKLTALKRSSLKRSRVVQDKAFSEEKKPKITPNISLEGKSLIQFFTPQSKAAAWQTAIPLPLFNYFPVKPHPKPFAFLQPSPPVNGDWRPYFKHEVRRIRAPKHTLISISGTPLQYQTYKMREVCPVSLRRNPFFRYPCLDYEAESEEEGTDLQETPRSSESETSEQSWIVGEDYVSGEETEVCRIDQFHIQPAQILLGAESLKGFNVSGEALPVTCYTGLSKRSQELLQDVKRCYESASSPAAVVTAVKRLHPSVSVARILAKVRSWRETQRCYIISSS